MNEKDEVKIHNINVQANTIEIAAEHPFFMRFAEECAKLLAGLGGENYLSVRMNGKDVGDFEVLIRRAKGKTPAERVIELERAVRVLLDAKKCLTNNEPEIPEAISAEFDIGLDQAREIISALTQEDTNGK